MKVALVTGPCPPGVCGVGDYTACLAKALKTAGVEAQLIDSANCNLSGIFSMNKSLREQNFDIVHIQYPTAGFGTKLGAQGLSLLRRCVVTVHEASQRRILRQLSLIPFAFRSKHVLFTSESERLFAMRWIPWVSQISSVIPVGSNIPRGVTKRPRRVDEIVYFGLVIPGKGLEQVLELSGLIKMAGLPLTVRVLGKVPPRHADYYRTLRSQAEDLPVVWSIALSEQQIAEHLSEASISYLPYPDGASERRTTLKAALLNGVAVITTRGAHTPTGLEGVVKFCQTAQEALDVSCGLLRDRDELGRMARSASRFMQAQDWKHIAEEHRAMYESVLGGCASMN